MAELYRAGGDVVRSVHTKAARIHGLLSDTTDAELARSEALLVCARADVPRYLAADMTPREATSMRDIENLLTALDEVERYVRGRGSDAVTRVTR